MGVSMRVCVSVLTKLSCLSVVCVGSGMLSVVCLEASHTAAHRKQQR